MSTINKELAEKLVANNGSYEGDPQCYAVFKYFNRIFLKHCYAVVYDEHELNNYKEIHRIREILWKKDK